MTLIVPSLKPRLYGVASRARWCDGSAAAASGASFGGDSGRMLMVSTVALSSLRVLTGNFWRGFDAAISNKYITESTFESTSLCARAKVGYAIEYPLGTIIGNIKWNGGDDTIDLNPGELAYSDLCVLSATIPVSTVFYVRAYYECGRETTSGRIPVGRINSAATNEGAGRANPVVDQRTLGSPTYSVTTPTFPAIAITTDSHASGKAVLVMGDSIGEGNGYPHTGYSWVELMLQNISAFSAATRSDTAYATHGGGGYGVINSALGNVRAVEECKRKYIKSRLQMVRDGQITHVIIQFGRNDLTDGQTGSQIGTNVTALIALLKAANAAVKCYVCTIPPKTTSTDSWKTLANQTVDSTDTERAAYNTAVRAVTFGQDGNLDIAAAVESGSTGKWNIVTTTGNCNGTPTASSVVDTSGFFPGQKVISSSGGVAGSLQSKTSTTLTTNANMTSGSAATITGYYTDDGIHPNTGGAWAIATALGSSPF